MTYKEVNQMIASIGLPYAYYQFTKETAKPTPFICFYYPKANDLLADNLNYQGITGLAIELYADTKDFDNEAKIEAVLKSHGLTWAKEETYIDTEQMLMTLYELEVLINGEQS